MEQNMEPKTSNSTERTPKKTCNNDRDDSPSSIRALNIDWVKIKPKSSEEILKEMTTKGSQ